MKKNWKKSVIIFAISLIGIFCSVDNVFAINSKNTPNLDIKVEPDKSEYKMGESIPYKMCQRMVQIIMQKIYQ